MRVFFPSLVRRRRHLSPWAILAQARLLRLIDHGCHHLRGERRDVRRTPGASADIDGGILQIHQSGALTDACFKRE